MDGILLKYCERNILLYYRINYRAVPPKPVGRNIYSQQVQCASVLLFYFYYGGCCILNACLFQF